MEWASTDQNRVSPRADSEPSVLQIRIASFLPTRSGSRVAHECFSRVAHDWLRQQKVCRKFAERWPKATLENFLFVCLVSARFLPPKSGRNPSKSWKMMLDRISPGLIEISLLQTVRQLSTQAEIITPPLLMLSIALHNTH